MDQCGVQPNWLLPAVTLVGNMWEVVQQLAETNLFMLAFSVLIFDIPRFTLSLVSFALFGVRRRSAIECQ